jgi:vacuolar-type H+-ATPase subunit E/Vma4
MADTLKSFIDKLQAEGVQTGQQAAEKIREQAEAQAKTIIEQAQAKAKEIVAQGRAECESRRTKTENELKLAARDTVSKLQETLTHGLQGVLNVAVREKLTDADFLGKLLYDIVMQYVKADIEGTPSITITVSEEMRGKLAEWAIKTFHGAAEKPRGVDLKGTLNKAGFEYQVSGGTVEVTVESATETLQELLGPEVRKIVADAVKTGK